MTNINEDELLVDGRIEAAIYPRVSTVAQEAGYSLQTQEAAMLDKARELGWRVRRSNIFREVFTGEALFERPVLTALRAKVAQGDLEGVLFYDVDRFARDPVWIEMVTQECFHFGVQVAFVRGGEDLSKDTPEARILRMLRGFAAQTELGQIRERIARGKRARLEGGKRLTPCSRGPLFGYRYRDAEAPDPGKRTSAPKVAYETYEPEAALVRQIFEWACASWTCRGIAIELNRRGIPAARGGAWSRGVVADLLNETAYYGEGYANKVEFARNCVDPEKYLLRAGFAYCGADGCGLRMHVKQYVSRGKPTSGYKCDGSRHGADLPSGQRSPSTTIRAHILDAQVWAHVSQLLGDKTFLQRHINEMLQRDPTERDLAALNAELGEVSRHTANLTSAIAQCHTDEARAILVQQLDAAAGQQAQLEEQRSHVLEQREGWLAATAHLKSIQSWFDDLRGTLADLPYERKRQALEAIGLRVTVYPRNRLPRWEARASIALEADEATVSSPTANSNAVVSSRVGW